MLRAQKIKRKTNGAVIPVGGQTVSQFDSSRVLSDVVTYLSASHCKNYFTYLYVLKISEHLSLRLCFSLKFTRTLSWQFESLSDMYSLFKLCLHANFISENQVRYLSVNKILLLFGTVLSFTF